MTQNREYSITTGEIANFGAADYLVTAAMLLVSIAIGVCFVVKDRHHGNMLEYLLGGRRMHFIPVSMSLLVSYISALSMLGAPVEVYKNNSMMVWCGLAASCASLVAGRIYIPFFYDLKITNVFQYLEMRFDRKVRMLVLSLIQTIFYSSLVLYAPSLTLSAVTGFSLWGILFVLGSVSTLYTVLGGMKAVLWTDTLQAVIMFVGVSVLLAKGSAAVGGFTKAWEIAENRSRIKLDEFSFNPTIKYSVWSILIGLGTSWTAIYGTQQPEVQRALSASSIATAQIALAVNAVGIFVFYVLLTMTGLVLYAFYSDCHPVSFDIIDKDDQLLPLLVMDLTGDTPGLSGLILSSILCRSLSTISSVLNALGVVIPDDVIRTFCWGNMTDREETRMSKITICGVIIMGVACLASQLGTLFQTSVSLSAVLTGPMLGTFSLGMFIPWANAKGAFIGHISAVLFTGWVAMGALLIGTTEKSLLMKTSGCNWNITSTLRYNVTMTTTTLPPTSSDVATSVSTTTSTAPSMSFLSQMYHLSYYYYPTVGAFVVLVVGTVASFIIGPTRPESLDPRLICPLFDRIFPCFPEKVLKPLRCGVIHKGKYRSAERTVCDVTEPIVEFLPQQTHAETVLNELPGSI